MLITTNEAFIKRHRRIGALTTAGGLVVLAAGMYVSFTQSQRVEYFWVPWVTLGLGIILLNLGKFNTSRWSTSPRIDEALVADLKGLDHHYKLYNYQPSLPVEHLLITPIGLFAIEARPFLGDIYNEGDRWWRKRSLSGFFQSFTEGGIGNPSREAQRSAEAVRKLLDERLGADGSPVPEVWPLVVFTSPRVHLHVTNPAVPVITPRELRGVVKPGTSRPKMSGQQNRKLEIALGLAS